MIQIYRKDINFWNIPSRQQLENMCEENSYPPRYVLKVIAANSTSTCNDTRFRVQFPGAICQFFREELVLTVPLKGSICGSRCKYLRM